MYSDLDAFFRGDGSIDNPRPQGLQKGVLMHNIPPAIRDAGIRVNYKALIDEVGGGYLYCANDRSKDYYSHN